MGSPLPHTDHSVVLVGLPCVGIEMMGQYTGNSWGNTWELPGGLQALEMVSQVIARGEGGESSCRS